jgi:hypothetical protein
MLMSNGHDVIERLASIALVRDEDLAHETHTQEARALLERVVATPAEHPQGLRMRPRWLRLAAPVGLAAAAAAAIAVAVSIGGHGTPSAAAATLRKVAAVAAKQTALVPGPGQYLYTKSVDAYEDTTVPAAGASAAYNVLVPHVREIWLGPDGGRLYETSGTPQFLLPQDRERWIAAGSPSLTEPPSKTVLPPAEPLDLPADPGALYDRLEQQASGSKNPLPIEMFTLVGDALRETSATAAQRAALYQVAARLPGVELVGRVRDSAGREGTAVAMTAHGIRFTLIFDPSTSALLGEEQVAVAGNPDGYEPGTRVGYATYLVQAIVDSDTARP